ncbi:MAG: hypothetical protein OXU20_23795 [Myxococcales bacterium]|nr:hypothetical protein [Myxococcales bacterium]MDD9967377.1 hypothetical protein [Myxococcales bacterium]
MFQDLRAELSRLEASVESLFDAVSTNVQKVKGEVETIDHAATQPLDRINATVRKVETEIASVLADVRREIEKLQPPKG